MRDNENKIVRVMIIAPHPDDAELAMGGTIAMMIERGWDVVVVDLTDGEPTPLGTKKLREQETKKASLVLGIKKRICLQMSNRYLEAELENRRKLAECIRINRPDLIFGPVLPDYHPDHIAAAELVVGARFQAKFRKTDMEGRPHWTAGIYRYYSVHRRYHKKPSFIVDVSRFWDKKIETIKAYQSQITNTSAHNGVSMLERIEVNCRYFGQCIGCKYGEPFIAEEPMGVRDIAFL